MANFQTAPKLRIVNTPEQFNLIKLAKTASGSFEPATGADLAEVLANTDLLKVEGFAELHSDKLIEGVKTLSIPGQKESGTLTLTAPGGITVGEEISVEMIVKTFNLEHEFVRFDGHNRRSRFYQIYVKHGDTVNTLAGRIADLINADADHDGYVFAEATANDNVVTVTAAGYGWTIDFRLRGTAITNRTVVGVYAVTQPAFEGRNSYRQMNVKRLQNPNRNWPYATGHYVAANEVPQPGSRYSSVIAKFKVHRTDLSGPEMQNSGPVTGEYGIEVYFLDGNAQVEAIRDEFVAWCKANATTFIEYNATTPAAALANEVPVVTTN